MLRLIGFMVLLIVVVIAIAAALGTILFTNRTTVPEDNRAMVPVKFRRVTYVLLILLMFGVTTGWLGGV